MEQLIPRLRFREFEGEWAERTIEDSIDFLSGYAFKAEEISDDESGIPLLRGINITEGRIRHSLEMDKYFCGDTTRFKKYFLEEEDLVIGMDGSKVGRNTALIDEFNSGSILIQRVARLRKIKNTSLKFIYHQINSSRFHSYVDEVKTSSGIPHISASDIKNFKIYFPTLVEQSKVALFITNIDEKLTALKKKKSLLEKYKKGMMEKIFNQEIRFKDEDGKDFGEWQEKTLGEIGQSFIGLTYSPDNIVEEGGTLVLRSSNVQDSSLSFNDNVYVDVEMSEKNYVRENDILICARNGSKNLIGKCAIIKKEHEGHAFGAFMTIYRSEYNTFLFHFFKSPFFIKQVHEHLGATINQITTKSLNGFLFPFPSKKEQTKIANFLSVIDDKINLVAVQIEKMEKFKKGLLGEMFV